MFGALMSPRPRWPHMHRIVNFTLHACQLCQDCAYLAGPISGFIGDPCMVITALFEWLGIVGYPVIGSH